jgi:hypothetical protein
MKAPKLGLDASVENSPIKVVKEYFFEEVCCLGMSKQGHITIENASDSWIQCSLRTTSTSADSLSTVTSCLFRVPDLLTLAPKGRESMKLVFHPSHAPATVPGRLVITCSRISDDAHCEATSASSSSIPHLALLGPPVCVQLQATAELPNIQMVSENSENVEDLLDFGLVPSDCHRLHSISFLNRGKSTVPIRLRIQSNISNHGFVIGEHDTATDAISDQTLTKFILKGITKTALLGQQPIISSQEVTLTFKSNFSADFVTLSQSQPPKVVAACLVAELDVPGPVRLLAAKKLQATSGFVRLRTSANRLSLTSVKGERGSAVVSIQNAGNIHMGISVSVQSAGGEQDDGPLNVWPSKLFVPPHQKTKDLLVRFLPQKEYPQSEPCRGIVLLKVEPNGPSFEIDVTAFNPDAKATPADSNPVPQSQAQVPLSEPLSFSSTSTSKPEVAASSSRSPPHSGMKCVHLGQNEIIKLLLKGLCVLSWSPHARLTGWMRGCYT